MLLTLLTIQVNCNRSRAPLQAELIIARCLEELENKTAAYTKMIVREKLYIV